MFTKTLWEQLTLDLFLGVGAAIGLCLAGNVVENTWQQWPAPAVFGVRLVVLLGAGLLMCFFYRARRASWPDRGLWFSAAAVALFAGCAGNTLQRILERQVSGPGPWVTLGVFAALLLFSAAWLRRVFRRLRARSLETRLVQARKHLVLFLSENSRPPSPVPLNGSIEDDLRALVAHKEKTRQFWNWEQPLRGMAAHASKAPRVKLLCSEESIQRILDFRENVLKPYTGGCFRGARFEVLLAKSRRFVDLSSLQVAPGAEEGLKFLDFDDVSRGLSMALELLEQEGVRDEEVTVDFTGGQKIPSVAAAVATFDRKLQAQYVKTNPDYEAVTYRIIPVSQMGAGG
jgi:hypothetical protein